MSGFEIAGVVIGAIPLLVEGLQSYSEGVSILSDPNLRQSIHTDVGLTWGRHH